MSTTTTPTAQPTCIEAPVDPAAPTAIEGGRRVTKQVDRAGDERGFAMVWFGLVLIVLLTMAGAAIDVWGWWYNGTLHQRAADSAALAGVVFLPEDPATARATALDIAQANGVAAADVTIETSADDATLAPNEMRVTVGRRINTRFLQLVGVTGAQVDRDAVAQYTSRLPMGSPEQFLGRDPERGEDPGFWISVSGRGEAKIGGDRYQNISCGVPVFNCNAGTSTEYSTEGYAFSVELNGPPTGDLHIEVYDPVHTETGAQDCTNTGYLSQAVYDANKAGIYNSLALVGIAEANATSDARYAAGDTIYCQGDVGGGRNPNPATTGNVTTFIVREPDSTQALDFDNPAIDTGTNPDIGCTRQFRAVDLNHGTGNRSIYEILNLEDRPLEVNDVAEGLYALRNYRRWVPLCTIPQATVAGWYSSGLTSVIVQVRSNADLNAPFTATTNGRSGRNHFAMRAGYGSATNSSNVSIYAQGRLPIHNGADGASTTEFFLTRIPPGNAGRTLSLEFYDVADASQPAVFTVVPPSGFGGSFTDCTFIRYSGNNDGTNTGQDMSADASGCTLNNVNNARYNGRVTDVRVKVPATYTCNVADINDCWIKVRVTYSSGGKVFDHTVWDAGVVGEPVRLIE